MQDRRNIFDEKNMETCSANEFMLTTYWLFRIIKIYDKVTKIIEVNYRELNIDESAD